MFLMLTISILPTSAESFEKVESIPRSNSESGILAAQNVTYRLLAVEQYFDSTPMKSGQYLIKAFTGYKNWQNVTWGRSKYTAYIHLLSYASIDPTLTQFYRGTPTNSNVANEITNFLGQTGPGENNSLTIRILYYNGHSGKAWMQAQNRTVHYMCLGQSPYQKLYDYQLNNLLNKGDLKTNNCTLVILDTCYSGGFITKLSRGGRVILTACTKDQLAWGWISSTPAPGYWGWFTGHSSTKFNASYTGPVGIIGGIHNAQDNNGDGWRSAGEVFTHAKPSTQEYAKAQGRTEDPQSDYWVLGGGIPLVMSREYVTFIFPFPPWVLKIEQWFVYNAPPTKLIVIPRPWSMFHSDSSRTGFTSAFGPGTSPLWIKSLTDPISSSVAIHDGIVFVGTEGGGGGGGGAALYALSWETGEIIWKFQTDSQIYSSPAVNSGAVIFGTLDGRIYALEEYTGLVRWMNYTYAGGTIRSSPAVADGMVFIGSSDGYVQALNETTGWLIWSYLIGGSVDSSPAVSNGRVFVGTTGGAALPCLYALNEFTGLPLWSALPDNPIISTPAVADGLVFASTMGGLMPPGIYVFTETGGPIWNYALPAPVSSSPAVDSSNAMVIVGCLNGYVYAFNEFSGPPALWSYPTGAPIDRSSPAISSNGYVYVGNINGYVYCLNELSGGKVWDYLTGGAVISSPAITDDHLISGSTDGNVYNFGPPIPVHDIAVLDVQVSPLVVFKGELVKVIYTVRNKGNVAETFNVTIARNSTEVWTPPLYNDTITITTEEIALRPETQTTITYYWNTSDTPVGTHTVSVQVQQVSEETNTDDNLFVFGDVVIKLLGDFDGDGDVDYDDIVYFVTAYINYWSGMGKDPACDFDNDCDIDYDDILAFVTAYIDYWTP